MDEPMYLTPRGKKLSRDQVARRLAAGKPVQAPLPLDGVQMRLPTIDPLALPAGGSLFGDTTGQQTHNLLSSSPEAENDAA